MTTQRTKRGGKANAISDRSGFKFPMSEMVLEPGTNYLVHRSESDGAYSINNHPLNNVSKYLRGKQGDPYPVKNARPEQEINAVPNYTGSIRANTEYYVHAVGEVLNTGVASVVGIASAVGSGLKAFVGQAFATGVGTGSAVVLPTSMLEVEPSSLFDIDPTNTASYGGTGNVAFNLTNASTYSMDFTSATISVVNSGTPSARFERLSTGSIDMGFVAANTTFLNNLHKNNVTDWWLAVSFRYVGTGFFTLLSTITSGAGNGVEFLAKDSSTSRLNIDRAGVRTTHFLPKGFANNEDGFVCISYNSLDDTLKVWINEDPVVSVGDASALTSSVDATGDYTMFSRPDGGLAAALGSRIYGLAGGNSYLDDSEVNAIRDTMELRTQRTFNT